MLSAQEISAPLIQKEEGDQVDAVDQENSPIEQVALTVPVADDPTLPIVTFRLWILGTLACAVLSFLNQFFWYRREPLSITSISAQIAVVPLGHLMASAITERVFFKGRNWEFTLNPGPFNVKEHVLITIFANSGAGNVYAVHIVSAVKVFYQKKLTFVVSLIVVLTTQVLGFGWAGMFRRFLVEPAAMWWPQNLVQVSLFRALHEKEKRPKGGLTRNQFFLIAFTCSFAYYVFPGHLFPMLTSLSWLCYLFPNSILAHQLGSGLHGLGIGTLGFDWSSISSYLRSPLASPWFATANIALGFVLIMYVITPIAYWLNLFNAKSFPIFSDGLFTSTGQEYNITAIVDPDFHIDFEAYEREGPLYLSTCFAMTYALSFACLTATVVHVFLFHGRELWEQSKTAFQEKMDVHTKLMRKYKQVPEWWFSCILLVNITVTIFTCEYYKDQLQLPWWGVLLACGLAFIFTLPIGVITATTNQTPGLNVVTEYIIGYIYPGYPVANMCFKVYGYISMKQGITFLQDFKLGHYMKIPPRTMFMAQMCVFLCLGGNSTTWLNTAVLVTCMRNFKHNQGPVSGILKGYLGLSTAIFTDLSTALFSSNPSTFLLCLALVPAAICFAAALFLRETPPPTTAQETKEPLAFHFFNAVAVIVAFYLLAFDVSGVRSRTISSVFAVGLLVLLASPLLVPVYYYCIVVVVKPGSDSDAEAQVNEPLLEEEEVVPPEEIVEPDQEVKEEDGVVVVVEVKRWPVIGEDHTIVEAMQSVDFWMLFGSFLCGVGTGMCVINNMGQMGKALGYDDVSIFVSLTSIGGFFGRIISGMASEYYIRTCAMPRPLWNAASELLMACGFIIMAIAFTGSLYIGSIVVGICYGVRLAVTVPIASELFGLKYYGLLYNILILNLPLGSFLFSGLLAGYLYDAQAIGSAGGGSECIGPHCYRLVFVIMALACVLGLGLDLLLAIRMRGVYLKIHLDKEGKKGTEQ